MKTRISLFCALSVLFLALQGKAQDKQPDSSSTDKTSSTKTRTSYWEAGVHYINDNVYLGRKDSATIPYLTTSLGYYHSSGLYVNGSMSYTSEEGQGRIDLFTLEGGYEFSAGNFNGGLSAAKYFYNAQSANVAAEMKGSLSAYAGYDLNVVTLTAEGSMGFSTKPDFTAAFGMEHSFSLADDKLEITPTVTANASTQNYYDGYYSNRRYKVSRKRQQSGGPSYYDVSAMVENASKFKILDYELSLPIKYTLNSFRFKLTPVLAIPVNPAHVAYTVKPAGGRSTTYEQVEQIGNHFFIQAAVSVRF